MSLRIPLWELTHDGFENSLNGNLTCNIPHNGFQSSLNGNFEYGVLFFLELWEFLNSHHQGIKIPMKGIILSWEFHKSIHGNF